MLKLAGLEALLEVGHLFVKTGLSPASAVPLSSLPLSGGCWGMISGDWNIWGWISGDGRTQGRERLPGGKAEQRAGSSFGSVGPRGLTREPDPG